MLTEKREKLKKFEIKTGETFSKFGLTPNQYTLISLLFAFFSFYFLIRINLGLTLIFFLLAALLDFIDGAVAKFLKQETKKGAYLDTICDRYVEGIILLGFLFLPLPNFLFSAKAWIFLAFFGSLMTTYAKAAAKEKELVKDYNPPTALPLAKGERAPELKGGLLGRAERMILITLAIALGIFNLSWMIYPIIILAIFSNLTALQRIYLSLSQQ